MLRRRGCKHPHAVAPASNLQDALEQPTSIHASTPSCLRSTHLASQELDIGADGRQAARQVPPPRPLLLRLPLLASPLAPGRLLCRWCWCSGCRRILLLAAAWQQRLRTAKWRAAFTGLLQRRCCSVALGALLLFLWLGCSACGVQGPCSSALGTHTGTKFLDERGCGRFARSPAV